MKIVKKLFFVWNEKEERVFLEKMAKQGYTLTKVKFGKYYFEETNKTDIVYQFDFKGLDNLPEDEYIQMYKDDGWELNCRYGGWYYFSKARDNTKVSQSIFSNNESKKAKYKRLIKFLLIVGFPLFIQFLIIYPNMEPSTLEYPNFYFFARIISILLTILYALALTKIIGIYMKLSRSIKE